MIYSIIDCCVCTSIKNCFKVLESCANPVCGHLQTVKIMCNADICHSFSENSHIYTNQAVAVGSCVIPEITVTNTVLHWI